MLDLRRRFDFAFRRGRFGHAWYIRTPLFGFYVANFVENYLVGCYETGFIFSWSRNPDAWDRGALFFRKSFKRFDRFDRFTRRLV